MWDFLRHVVSVGEACTIISCVNYGEAPQTCTQHLPMIFTVFLSLCLLVVVDLLLNCLWVPTTFSLVNGYAIITRCNDIGP